MAGRGYYFGPYFASLFAKSEGFRQRFTLKGAATVLRSALAMGAARVFGLLTYNFDSVLLGFFLSPVAVGLYRAAYSPITMTLTIAQTYFIGLAPVLSRTLSRTPRGSD
jgi:O-antigen/teichoic acid export membrane protein